MEETGIANLELLKAFRRCAHIQHHMSRFQGQSRILILLLNAENGAMTQRELAEITQRRAATLSEQLESMERAGLITREKSRDDRRNIDVRLTGAGRLTAMEAEREREEIADLLFSHLSGAEKAELHRILSALGERWSKITMGERAER